MIVDRKFRIHAKSREHDHHYSELDSVLFLAKDRAFLVALAAYLTECRRLGCDERQIAGAEGLYARVKEYQATNPTKIPDVDDSAIGDYIADQRLE